jgi:hypothetical protein
LKRVIIISDLHCGHWSGLTPPAWQYKPERNQQRHEYQKTIWDWYYNKITSFNSIDLLIVNGDAVDGSGKKTGGSENITSDLYEQAEIAAFCIKQSQSKQIAIIRGTPYHAFEGLPIENIIAGLIDADNISDHAYFEIYGNIIDCRHKVGSSSIPHGKFTPIAKEMMWNILSAERGRNPKANILVRSHVHYFIAGQDAKRRFFTTPCLQGSTTYGSQQCSGIIDIGLIELQFNEDGSYNFIPHLLDIQFDEEEVIKV